MSIVGNVFVKDDRNFVIKSKKFSGNTELKKAYKKYTEKYHDKLIEGSLHLVVAVDIKN